MTTSHIGTPSRSANLMSASSTSLPEASGANSRERLYAPESCVPGSVICCNVWFPLNWPDARNDAIQLRAHTGGVMGRVAVQLGKHIATASKHAIRRTRDISRPAHITSLRKRIAICRCFVFNRHRRKPAYVVHNDECYQMYTDIE